MPVRPLTVLVALALLLGTRAVRAQSDPDQAALDTARARHAAGAEAFDQGRYKDAIDLFLDARSLVPRAAFSYNIGLAYEQLDDAPNALSWFRAYLRDAPDAADRPVVEERIRSAQERLAERGVQQVTLLSQPSGATVSIEGKPVGVTPWTGELSPGDHDVVLTRKGYAEVRRSFSLPPHEAIDVSVALVETVPVAAPPLAAAPLVSASPDDTSPPAPRVSPLSWALVGLAGAGLGTALGLELARNGAERDARSAPTQVEGKERLDSANKLQAAARVAVGVGAAATLAAGVLIYVDVSGSKRRRTAVAAGCRESGCAILVNGRF